MPVASMATAVLLRWSADIVANWFCTVRSSVASMMNVRPILLSGCVICTPTSKGTVRGWSFSTTVALTRSFAVILSVGFIMSPVKST